MFSQSCLSLVFFALLIINLHNKAIKFGLDPFDSFFKVSGLNFSLHQKSTLLNGSFQTIKDNHHVIICCNLILHIPQTCLHFHLQLVHFWWKYLPVLLVFIRFYHYSFCLRRTCVYSKSKILKLTPQFGQLSLDHIDVLLLLTPFGLQSMNKPILIFSFLGYLQVIKGTWAFLLFIEQKFILNFHVVFFDDIHLGKYLAYLLFILLGCVQSNLAKPLILFVSVLSIGWSVFSPTCRCSIKVIFEHLMRSLKQVNWFLYWFCLLIILSELSLNSSYLLY